MRQLSLFRMICENRLNILHQLAFKCLAIENDSSDSWFVMIRQLCEKFSLPSPLFLLQSPPDKESFKTLSKLRIVDFYTQSLRAQAQELSSLQFFDARYMSLCRPHHIWLKCPNNPYEVNKTIIMTRMLSGRYVTDKLSRHWDKSNPHGLCLLCSNAIGSIQHLLISCDKLKETRDNVIIFWFSF